MRGVKNKTSKPALSRTMVAFDHDPTTDTYHKFCALETIIDFMIPGEGKEGIGEVPAWKDIKAVLRTCGDAYPCKEFARVTPSTKTWLSLFRCDDAYFPRCNVLAARHLDAVGVGALGRDDACNALRAACISNCGQLVAAAWRHCQALGCEEEVVESVLVDVVRAPVTEGSPLRSAAPALYRLSGYFAGLLNEGRVHVSKASAVRWFVKRNARSGMDLVKWSVVALAAAFKRNDASFVLALHDALPDGKQRMAHVDDLAAVCPGWEETVFREPCEAFVEHLRVSGALSPYAAAMKDKQTLCSAFSVPLPKFWASVAPALMRDGVEWFDEGDTFNPWLLGKKLASTGVSARTSAWCNQLLHTCFFTATYDPQKFALFKGAIVEFLPLFTKDPGNFAFLQSQNVLAAFLCCDLLEGVPRKDLARGLLQGVYCAYMRTFCGQRLSVCWRERRELYEKFFDAKIAGTDGTLDKFCEMLERESTPRRFSLQSVAFLVKRTPNTRWLRRADLDSAWRERLAQYAVTEHINAPLAPSPRVVVEALKAFPQKAHATVPLQTTLRTICRSWNEAGFFELLSLEDKDEVMRSWFTGCLRDEIGPGQSGQFLRYVMHDLGWKMSHASFLDILLTVEGSKKRQRAE